MVAQILLKTIYMAIAIFTKLAKIYSQFLLYGLSKWSKKYEKIFEFQYGLRKESIKQIAYLFKIFYTPNKILMHIFEFRLWTVWKDSIVGRNSTLEKI